MPLDDPSHKWLLVMPGRIGGSAMTTADKPFYDLIDRIISIVNHTTAT